MSERTVHSPLLPPNQLPLEAALANAADLPLTPERVATLWDAAACPVGLLPWLAWALSVDEWDDAWPEDRKREAVLQAVQLHRKKGTPWAVLRALEVHGYPGCELIEYADYHRQWEATHGLYLDGSWPLDGRYLSANLAAGGGAMRHTVLRHWAQYAIRVNAAEEVWSRQAQRKITQVAKRYAPARAHLAALIGMLRMGFYMPCAMRSTARLRVRFTGCTRLSATGKTHLDGCWLLDADKRAPVLDGAWRLDGAQALHTTYSGQRLDSGHLRMRQRVRQRLDMHAGGERASCQTLAARLPALDGRWSLNTHTLAGTWSLGQGLGLADARLSRLGLQRLDGTWPLGGAGHTSGIWMHGRAIVRRAGQTTMEPLQ